MIQVSIDIPEYYIPISRYCATLAHKACHSFNSNAQFEHLEHPRYGKIMSISCRYHVDIM